MKLTKVIINSVTIKDSNGGPDPNKVISWEYEKSDEDIPEATIVVPKNVTDLVDLTNGQVVEIHGGWSTSTDQRFFYGFIDKIIPQGPLYKLICKNEMGLLVRKNVNKIYDSSIDPSAGEISAIAEDLIETYGGLTANVQSSGTADGQILSQFKCINTDIYERLVSLRKALGWDLFYDDDAREVHFEPKGYTSSGMTLTVGTEIVGVPEWDIDTTYMINDLRVDGAYIQTQITESGQIGVDSGYATSGITLTKTPDIVELFIDSSNPPTTQRQGGNTASSAAYYYVDRENKQVLPSDSTSAFTGSDYAIVNYVWSAPAPIHMFDQESIDNYGSYEKTIELSDVISVADAEARARNILAERSTPFLSAKFLVKSTSTTVPARGNVVSIVDTVSPTVNGAVLSGDYVVTKVKYMFPSPVEEIEVGQSALRLTDWGQNVEDRLKRLEEQFIRNQDILMELVDMKHDSTKNLKVPVPRYRKRLRQDYTTGDNTLIWDNSDHGIWDTDNWAAASNLDGFDDAVEDFVLQYQNSYSESFFDTDFEDSSNSTAAWGSSQCEIEDGETARSSSIDLNNGTITTATVTFTGTGTGSQTYYLSADGGSNWEAVTSGAAHTFSNTGADLRWRADNSGGTWTLTNVTITDYH